MKRVLLITIAFVSLVFIISLSSQDFTYVGAAKCKICHRSETQGKQFPIWEESLHSKSFTALTSDEAKAISSNASENPECLKCHAPLSAKAPELKGEGVTCEACHGPGSLYKKMSIMKNREESVKNGLIAYDSTEAMKKQCLTCHLGHDKPFDFDTAWSKIKHTKPGE